MTTSGSSFDKVTICSGHMIDAPGRETPRFPERKADAVRARIGDQLAQWEIGEDDLAICGGACGSDTLFAEECQRRGTRVRLLLAQAVDDFVRDSVSTRATSGCGASIRCARRPRSRSYRTDPSSSLTTNRFTPGPIFGSSIRPRTRPVILGRFTRCSFGTKNPPATGPAGRRIFSEEVCDLGGRSRSSIRRRCHDCVLRILRAATRITGKVA